MPKKLFVIDAMAMAFRNHHAFGHRPLTTEDGTVVSSVFGSANFLIKLIEDERPDYLAIATDTSSPTFRHKMYDAYKANRSEMPEELAHQIPILYELFGRLGIQLLREEGVEADDLIGSLVHQNGSEELECYMVSGDKDFLQLINHHVFLYSPKKGGVVKIVNSDGVGDKFPGCGPEHVVDVLALMGDSSDNVPGVPGIGEKGAAKLIATFGSLDGIYDNIEKITNKRQHTGLKEFKDQAYLSRALVTIKTDLEIPYSLEQLRYDSSRWASAELIELFQDLQFRGLTDRAEKNLAQAHLQNGYQSRPRAHIGDKKRNYQLCNTEEKINACFAKLAQAKEICFDTETTGLDIMRDQPIGISFSVANGEAFYVPLVKKHLAENLSIDELKSRIGEVLAGTSLKIAHNAKFDIQMLGNIDIRVEGEIHDTMLCSYLLDPSHKSHGLDACCERHLHYEKISITTLAGKDKKKPMDEAPLSELSEYACEDADLTLQLYHHLLPALRDQGLMPVFSKIEAPLVRVLADMEQNGIYLDGATLAEFSKDLGQKIDQFSHKIHELAGEDFNINSTKQLQAILFDKLRVHEQLGIKRLKKTKTGYSTDSSVLEKLAEHPLAQLILDYRTVTKLKNTYVDTLPQLVSKTSHRLHTHFHQTGTATGRLSSSNPNLQNIPIRTELGKNIRRAFCVNDTERVLISADYSQVELRLLAHIANESALIAAFKSGADIHTSTAAKIFNLNPEEVDASTRSKAKAINFGIIYGMGPQRLARTTHVKVAEAKEFIEMYFKGFPKIKDYIRKSIEDAREKGYTETITGRKRLIPEIHSKDRMTLVNAENIAVNSPIQGSAADLIKLAMIQIHERIRREKPDIKMLLQVHDELVFECHKKIKHEMVDMIRSEMESAMQLNVPLRVDVGIGSNWLEAH